MKVAILLHGIVGGTGGRNGIGQPIDIVDCFKTMNYNILSKYDCDVFAHSWSTDQAASTILNLYSPIYGQFEPQEYFGFDKNDKGLSTKSDNGMKFRMLSKYYSLKKAVKLKKQYEIENDFKYDWVFATRYDLVYLNSLVLEDKISTNFYVVNNQLWKMPPHGKLLHDIIFMSSSNNIDAFSSLYDDMISGIYNPSKPHMVVCLKAIDIMGKNPERLKFVYERFKDVEVYRQALKPEDNYGDRFGARKVKGRLEKLLKEIG